MANLFNSFKPNGRVAIIPQEEGEVKPFSIDVTTAETHTFSAQVTEFPIEKGASISDHVIIKPFKLTLNCIISDNPIQTAELLPSNIIGFGSSVFGSEAALVASAVSKIGGDLLAKGRDKISKTAKETLEGFWKDKILVTVATGLEVYSNMLIENITIPRNSANASSLSFSVVLKQVTIVSKEFIKVDLTQAIEEAVDKVNQGKQAAEEASAAVSERGASVLSKLSGVGQ